MVRHAPVHLVRVTLYSVYVYRRGPFFFLRLEPKLQKKWLDIWELAEKPLTSCYICININQAMETIWWTIEGHSVMMWFAVSQSQAGLLDRPHLHISSLKRPTPVRSLLSLTRKLVRSWIALGWRDNIFPSLLVDGYHSADHILAIQWASVSLGRAVDSRFFPLVAKRLRLFHGDGVVEEVIWVHGTAGQCQTGCSPTKLCWWDACKHRELLYWCRL